MSVTAGRREVARGGGCVRTVRAQENTEEDAGRLQGAGRGMADVHKARDRWGNLCLKVDCRNRK